MGFAYAQTNTASPEAEMTLAPEVHTSFASLKQIKAGLLDVGYAEDGRPTVV